MRQIAILTDSTSDISKDLREQYGLDYLKMAVTVDGKEYPASLDYEQYTPAWIYGEMRKGTRVKTVQVTVEEFTKKFTEYLEKGMDIIYVACSSALSGSYNTGRVVAEELLANYPDAKIACVDARNSSMGEGLLAIEASELVKAGKTLEEVVATLENDRDYYHQWCATETLTYLARAGRVSAGKAFFGNMFGMKPILISNLKGENYAIKKVRGRKTSIDELATELANNIVDPENQTIAVLHADDEEAANMLKEAILAKVKVKGIYTGIIGPIIGASVGPGTVVTYFKGKKLAL
ncbi:MAG: DegV family protein [Bacilli bacterium]|nr:DegV family protein [Bacilli bacterium]